MNSRLCLLALLVTFFSGLTGASRAFADDGQSKLISCYGEQSFGGHEEWESGTLVSITGFSARSIGEKSVEIKLARDSMSPLTRHSGLEVKTSFKFGRFTRSVEMFPYRLSLDKDKFGKFTRGTVGYGATAQSGVESFLQIYGCTGRLTE